MKKLLKLFGLLLAMGTLFCLSSCDGLFGGNENEEETEIIHEFYQSDKKGYYYYYTSTTGFTYTTQDGIVYDKSNPCIYQVCFSQGANKGTWNMYTRTKASYNKIEDVYKDVTYEGDVSKDGEVKLYLEGKLFQTIKIETKTIQLTNTTPTTCVFTANIIAAHKKIKATDAK